MKNISEPVIYSSYYFFQASGGYNGLSNIKMEDGMTPSIPSMKVRQDFYYLKYIIIKAFHLQSHILRES